MKAFIRYSTAFLLGTLLVSTAGAQEVVRKPLPPDHPLIGTWRIELPALQCFEEYDLRADGVKYSMSGEERNESEFTLSDQPSEKGFYKWVDKLTKSNGKPDCSGHQVEVGHVAVNYIRLHPGKDKFLLCTAEDFKWCFAEFTRSK